jgi:hypothetical protein
MALGSYNIYNELVFRLNTKIGGVNSIPAANAPIMKVLSSVPTMIIGMYTSVSIWIDNQ